MSDEKQISLARPKWDHAEIHREEWKRNDVTVLICQRKSKDLTQICLESLLRFYPDVQVLVVDGDSQDDSTAYLRYMSKRYPNVKVWERTGRNSHGETMHDAVENKITTGKVLLLDSDTKIHRGGFIEHMLLYFQQEPKLYAVGSLMLVSEKNQACGDPAGPDDILRYAHPSCSMYDVKEYLRMYKADFHSAFCDHGAPCFANMIQAAKEGLRVEYYPIDRYVSHLCGASWQTVPTVWYDDDDITLRPFITFIATLPEQFDQLKNQKDHDFDIVTRGTHITKKVSTYERIGMQVDNDIYDLRFKVKGEYVCMLNEAVTELDLHTVRMIKEMAIANNLPAQFTMGGLVITERKKWQQDTVKL